MVGTADAVNAGSVSVPTRVPGDPPPSRRTWTTRCSPRPAATVSKRRSTPVTSYPPALGPVVNACAKSLPSPTEVAAASPRLLTRRSGGPPAATAPRMLIFLDRPKVVQEPPPRFRHRASSAMLKPGAAPASSASDAVFRMVLVPLGALVTSSTTQ